MAQEVVVALALEVRDPPAIDLNERDAKLGKPVEHPGEDELQHPLRCVIEVAGAGEICGHRALAHLPLDQANMDGQWLAARLDRLPNCIVLGRDGRLSARVALHEERHEPGHPGEPLNLLEASLDPTIREQCSTAEPIRGGRAELGHEVVVCPDHLMVEVDVLVAGHERARVVGPEDQLGIDPVLLHLLDPGDRVVAAGIDVIVGTPLAHVLRVTPRRRTPAEGERGVVAREHPRVSVGQPVHTRHPVLVLLGHSRRPHVPRLVEVPIGRDELVLRL